MNNFVINNDVEGVDLGGGVVLFENAINFDSDFVLNFCKEIVTKEKDQMYRLTVDPETGEEIYANMSGYFFHKETVDLMPARGSQPHRDQRKEVSSFFENLEKTRDGYLFKYLEFYPLAFKCIWWKVKGHIVSYKKGSHLGKHSDISTDYIYGVWTPNDQLAMRSTVTVLIYFNDCVDTKDKLNEQNFMGGHHYFSYLDITHVPKKGDILFFPASYTAAHEVKTIEDGIRYSYLGWYSQGTPNIEVKESVADPVTQPEESKTASNVYMPNFISDFREHLLSRGYDKFSYQYYITESNYGQ